MLLITEFDEVLLSLLDLRAIHQKSNSECPGLSHQTDQRDRLQRQNHAHSKFQTLPR